MIQEMTNGGRKEEILEFVASSNFLWRAVCMYYIHIGTTSKNPTRPQILFSRRQPKTRLISQEEKILHRHRRCCKARATKQQMISGNTIGG